MMTMTAVTMISAIPFAASKSYSSLQLDNLLALALCYNHNRCYQVVVIVLLPK